MIGRSTRAAAFSAAGLALAAAALAAANIAFHFVRLRLDLSSGGAYSISAGTNSVLSKLTDDLVIRVYFTRRLPPPYGLTEQYLRDLLDEYRGAGRGRVRVEWFDPADDARRREAAAAGIAAVQINAVTKDKFEAKEAFMGAVFLYKGKTEVLPIVEDPDELEYELTRRIKRLVDPGLKTVGFTSGHGEKGPWDPQFGPVSQLLKERLKTEPVDLGHPLPAGLEALWILEPEGRKFDGKELAALKAWVASGKVLGIFAGRRLVDFGKFQTTPLRTGLDELFAGWGLEMRDGFVVDAQSERISMRSQVGQFSAVRVQEYPFLPVVKNLDRENPATRPLDSVTIPFAHPLVFTASAGVRWTPLASSSRDSWYQTTDVVSPTTPFERLRSATAGPFALAGLLETGKGKVVVVASEYFVDPRFINKGSSAAFFLNLLDWSIQDADMLTIRAKGPPYRPLRRLSDRERFTAKYLMIIFPPTALLLAGFWLYSLRKRALAALPGLYAEPDA